MTKPSKPSTDRLLNLLYETTAKKVARDVPKIQQFLYSKPELLSSSTKLPTSSLDDLKNHDWSKSHFTKAIKDISKNVVKHKSNILKFKCPDSLLSFQDFYNLYPLKYDRQYSLPHSGQPFPFHVIKSRNPLNLLFDGHYYLIFQNYNQACVYWLETTNKVINGFEVNLQFVNSNANELKHMSSPFLDEKLNESSQASVLEQIKKDKSKVGEVPIKQLFKSSDSQSLILDEILKRDHQSSEFIDISIDPLFELISKFSNLNSRKRTVLVKNLPYNLLKYSLPKLLWNYDLLQIPDQSKCFTNIILDPTLQINLSLIRFENNENAVRFINNFHGKHWSYIQNSSHKEKKLYDPILCELI